MMVNVLIIVLGDLLNYEKVEAFVVVWLLFGNVTLCSCRY